LASALIDRLSGSPVFSNSSSPKVMRVSSRDPW
jgi:hypothetical protein